MEPGTPGPLVEAGRLMEVGDLDGAIRACQRAIRTLPDSFPAHLRLAQIYQRKHEQTRDSVVRRLADREFGEAMRLAPPDQTSHDALFELGSALGQTQALRARYHSAWASLPFAAAAIRRLDDNEYAAAPRYDPSSDSLKKIAIAAVLVVLASVAWQVGPRLWNRVQTAMVPPGDPAPEFRLEDLSGKKVALADFRGSSVVVLDFWATWCGPCRAALPAMHAFRQKYQGKGVEVLNINLSEDAGTISEYLRKEQLNLWVLLDRGNAITKAYGVNGIPCVVVIDKRGSKRETIVGYRPDLEARLGEIVDKLR